jgi:hypothetical protein
MVRMTAAPKKKDSKRRPQKASELAVAVGRGRSKKAAPAASSSAAKPAKPAKGKAKPAAKKPPVTESAAVLVASTAPLLESAAAHPDAKAAKPSRGLGALGKQAFARAVPQLLLQTVAKTRRAEPKSQASVQRSLAGDAAKQLSGPALEFLQAELRGMLALLDELESAAPELPEP